MSHVRKAHPHHMTSAEHAEALCDVQPVGAVFLSAVEINPHTLLGFGEWTLVGTDTLTEANLTVYVWRRWA